MVSYEQPRTQESYITTIIKTSTSGICMESSGFSWKQAKIDAIAMKLRRAKTMAINGNNPDFKLQHPDWVRDAQKKDFTLLTKVIKEKAEKYQQQAQARRDKRSGKT